MPTNPGQLVTRLLTKLASTGVRYDDETSLLTFDEWLQERLDPPVRLQVTERWLRSYVDVAGPSARDVWPKVSPQEAGLSLLIDEISEFINRHGPGLELTLSDGNLDATNGTTNNGADELSPHRHVPEAGLHERSQREWVAGVDEWPSTR